MTLITKISAAVLALYVAAPLAFAVAQADDVAVPAEASIVATETTVSAVDLKADREDRIAAAFEVVALNPLRSLTIEQRDEANATSTLIRMPAVDTASSGSVEIQGN